MVMFTDVDGGPTTDDGAQLGQRDGSDRSLVCLSLRPDQT